MSGGEDRTAGAVLGLGLGLGALSASIAALPAALRVASGVGSMLGAWLLLSGAAALILGPLCAAGLWLRSGPASEQRELGTGALALALAAGPLAILGGALKVGTHHRPLGGATFAVVALVVTIAVMLGVRRLRVWARDDDARLRRAGRGLLLVLSVVGSVVVAALLIRLANGHAPFQTAVLDGLNALGLWAIAVFGPLPAKVRRAGFRLGLPVWAGLVLVAVGLCRLAAVSTAAERAAPVLLSPLLWCSTGLGDG